MKDQKFITKREFIQQLGISKSTFYRLIHIKNIQISPKMLDPKTVKELSAELGFSLPELKD